MGTIWGERVGIRRLRPSDAGPLLRMMQDPEVADLLFEDQIGPLPSPFAKSLEILANRLSSAPEFGIVTRDGRLIGEVRLWRMSERNKNAMLTIYIGDQSCWGKGFGSEALVLLLQEAFSRYRLHRVELNVFDFNGRARRSYAKVGFVEEGVRRQALNRRGQFHDIVVMGILRDEFYARQAEQRVFASLR